MTLPAEYTQLHEKEVRQADRPYGLGRATLECNGLNPDHYEPYVAQNFVDQNVVVPYPQGDVYLSHTALVMAGTGETPIVPVQPEGVLEWHRAHTIGPHTSVIEVPLQQGAHGEQGYPYGDVVQAFHRTAAAGEMSHTFASNGKIPALITTFPGEQTAALTGEMGLEVVQNSHPDNTNCKARFREAAQTHGYRVFPGIHIYSEEDLQAAVDFFQKGLRGVASRYNGKAFMKQDGSGGDLVIPLTEVNFSTLNMGRTQLRSRTERAFANGAFDDVHQRSVWDSQAYAPRRGIVLEAHAENFGTMIANCSNLMHTYQDGTVDVLGYFAQMTSAEGSYLGSRPLFELPPIQDLIRRGVYTEQQIQAILDEQSHKVAHHNMQDNNYFGPQGRDFFLMFDEQEGLVDYNVELNGRLPISGIAEYSRRNSGAKTFINTNVWFPHDVNTMSDVEKAFTVDGERLTEGDPSRAAVQIAAMRAQWQMSPSGQRELVQPSNAMKVFFQGDDPARLDYLRGRMEAQGARFQESDA